jgi:hypothetical protein
LLNADHLLGNKTVTLGGDNARLSALDRRHLFVGVIDMRRRIGVSIAVLMKNVFGARDSGGLARNK